MPTNKMYGLLKILCEKGTVHRCDQGVLKSKWYFDLMVMKLQRANIVTVHDGSISITVIGRTWCKRYFMIEDGNE